MINQNRSMLSVRIIPATKELNATVADFSDTLNLNAEQTRKRKGATNDHVLVTLEEARRHTPLEITEAGQSHENITIEEIDQTIEVEATAETDVEAESEQKAEAAHPTVATLEDVRIRETPVTPDTVRRTVHSLDTIQEAALKHEISPN